MNNKKIVLCIGVIALIVVACSSSNDDRANSGDSGGSGLDVYSLVAALAADELEGRDNLTAGSERAQQLLVDELVKFAQPVFADAEGIAGYLQHYELGTNVLAIVPGGGLADEYVVIGGHYDHLGRQCADATAEDDICNGATDNAAGIAVALDVVRSIVADGVPRRSIIVAFWDGEEDDFDGSRFYIDNPVAALAKTVAYVNLDLQGSNLLPSLRNYTILVGAETGGAHLVDAATRAQEASTLDTVMLSLVFGQGRSDHAVFDGVGVPTVFFTDSNNGCYHSVKDDITAVDFPKLAQQIRAANALTRDLVTTDKLPVYNADKPVASYSDALQFQRIVMAAQSDFGLFTPQEQVAVEQFLLDVQAIIDAGPDAFDNAAVATLLSGASFLVSTIRTLECDPFLA